MARKKRIKKTGRRFRSKTAKKVFSVRQRMNIAWRNFTFFLVIFLIFFVFYNFSINELFRNFFGILSVIFGFLVFALLISLIVLSLLKSGRKR
jgi:hypothetical protein